MKKFETIDLDKISYSYKITIPDNCFDYQSDESEADFITKRGRVLLRVVSKFKGAAHEFAMSLFNKENIDNDTLKDLFGIHYLTSLDNFIPAKHKDN